MQSRKIPLFKIFNPGNIGQIVDEVYNTGIITEGDYADEFEEKFRTYVCAKHAALTNSGTSALELAAHLCNIEKGDEVIVSPLTCAATAEPFFNRGARLVFTDVDDSLNMHWQSIIRKLTPFTKAVVMVHWAGIPCNINSIVQIVKMYDPKIRVIQDAAHALGARYRGRKIGFGGGDHVMFSFQAIKHLSTIDGGALTSRFRRDHERIKKLRWFGLDRNFKAPAGFPPVSRWEQDITESGYKMHMNNVNAAIGLEQLKHIDWIVGRHQYNAKRLNNELKEKYRSVALKAPHVKHNTPSYWVYSILVDDKVKFKQYMDDNGIATDVVHVRLDKYSVFKDSDNTGLVNLDRLCDRMINIPCGWWLSDDDVSYIVKVVNAYES